MSQPPVDKPSPPARFTVTAQDGAKGLIAIRDDETVSSRLCHGWVERGLTKNPAIQFLVQHLVDLGCAPPDRFIRCTQCPRPQAGGFGMIQEEEEQPPPASEVSAASSSSAAPSCDSSVMKSFQQALDQQEATGRPVQIKPEIFLCQQYLENEIMAHKTLVHELIHAIDLCRTKMDPLNNCVHLACTEVRAENLSGECSFIKELPRMKQFAGHGADCVKRRALLSVKANPQCTERAEEYLAAAFPRCYRDLYPFGRHPNQK
jgi:inner membrane protease ATP23